MMLHCSNVPGSQGGEHHVFSEWNSGMIKDIGITDDRELTSTKVGWPCTWKFNSQQKSL